MAATEGLAVGVTGAVVVACCGATGASGFSLGATSGVVSGTSGAGAGVTGLAASGTSGAEVVGVNTVDSG